MSPNKIYVVTKKYNTKKYLLNTVVSWSCIDVKFVSVIGLHNCCVTVGEISPKGKRALSKLKLPAYMDLARRHGFDESVLQALL